MAKQAYYYKNDGTVCEVSAQEALELGDTAEFFCMGHDSEGNECGCKMSLKPRPLKAGGVSWHFCGRHISKCTDASFTKEINRTRKVLDKVGFQRLIDFFESEPKEGGTTNGGGREKIKKATSLIEKDDFSVEVKEIDVSPTTSKEVYTLILSSLPDESIDGITVSTLRCDEWAISRGLCKEITGVKLVVCERCRVPDHINRKDNEIVLRVNGIAGGESRYIILLVKNETVRKKVWNVLYSNKTEKVKSHDKFIVLGNFEAIDSNISKCNVNNSKMVNKL